MKEMTLELRLYGFTQVQGVVFDVLETPLAQVQRRGLQQTTTCELTGGGLADV